MLGEVIAPKILTRKTKQIKNLVSKVLLKKLGTQLLEDTKEEENEQYAYLFKNMRLDDVQELYKIMMRDFLWLKEVTDEKKFI